MATLTLSGNEITDALRTTGEQGDGETPPAGMGIWEANTPKNTVAFPGATAATSLTEFGSGTLTKESAEAAARFQGQEQWKLIADGADAQGVDWAGATGNTNAHSISLWCRVENLSGTCELSFDDGASNVAITGTSWVRVDSPGVTPGATDLMRVGFAIGATGTLYFQGADLSEQPIAMPVSADSAGATQARAAARARVTIADVSLSATQSWVAFRVVPGWDEASEPTTSRFIQWADGASDIIMVYWAGAAWGLFNNKSGGAAAQIALTADSWDTGDARTVIGAWEAANLKVSDNGSVFTATGSRSEEPVLAASTLDVGSGGTVAANKEIDGRFLWVAFGTGTLTDADAAAIDAFGDQPPGFGSMPGTCTGIWNAVDNSLRLATDNVPVPVAYHHRQRSA